MRRVKKIFLIFWLVPFVSFSQIEEYGISSLEDAVLADTLNIDVTRIFADVLSYTDSTIMLSKLSTLEAMHNVGVNVVLTALWDKDCEVFTTLKDNPIVEARLTDFKDFVLDAAPYIDYITIDDDAIFHYKEDLITEDANGKRELIKWYNRVVAQLNLLKNSNSSLSHIKICSPSFTEVTSYREGTMDSTRMEFFDFLYDWASSKAELWAIDLHLHDASATDIKFNLDSLDNRTTKPFISTEWSQAPVAFNWLTQSLNPTFADTYERQCVGTNANYFRVCYRNPVNITEWNTFIDGAPFSPGFMGYVYNHFVTYDVRVACYSQAIQDGEVEYDAQTLYATRTVKPDPAATGSWPYRENDQFLNWFLQVLNDHHN